MDSEATLGAGASFFSGQAVLVTGGTGFVGSHFVEELLSRGARIRVPIHRRALRVRSDRIEQVAADLTRPEDCLAACANIDCVVHAAGVASAAAITAGNPMADITTNLVLTSRMLEAAWTAGVSRFLLLSSSTVYPAANWPVREDEAWSAPPHPSYAGYGWIKRGLERLAEFVASKSSMKIALVRPTAVYGRHDNFDPVTGHVVPALVRKAVERRNPYEVWGTGDEIRDFVHVTDVVRGSLLALEKRATCDPINLGSGRPVAIKDVVGMILKVLEHDTEVHFDSSKPTTIPVRMVDISKARLLLGYEPQVPLEEGLADTIRWFECSLQAHASL